MGNPGVRSPGPLAAGVGLALAAASALPFIAGEPSVFEQIVDAFGRAWLTGVFVLLLLGAPYLLGLSVFAAAVLRSTLGLVLVRVPVTILYAELVFVCLLIATEPGDVRAPWSLFGFAAVTTVSGIARVARERRVGAAANVAWLARWGATIVAAGLCWLVLQDPMWVSDAPGLWATLATAAVLAGTSRAAR